MSRQISLFFLIFALICSFFINKNTYVPDLKQEISQSIVVEDITYKNRYVVIKGNNLELRYFVNDLDFKPGDEIGVKARIKQNFLEEFFKNKNDFAGYKVSKKIFYSGDLLEYKVNKTGFNFFTAKFYTKNYFLIRVDTLFGKYSAFIKALLLGDRSDVPKEDRDLFSKAGVYHMLALSGFHIGIIALVINIMLGQISVRKRGAVIIVLLLLYTFITGSAASTIRASLFFMVYYWAFLSEEKFNLFATSNTIATIMIIYNPYIIYDIGFYLSFLSVMSIALFYPMICKILKKFTDIYLIKYIIFIVSTQVLTLPLIMNKIGVVSIVGILSNFILIPIVSVMIILSIAAVGIDMFSFIGAIEYTNRYIVYLTNLLQDCFYVIANAFVNLPYSYIELKISDYTMYITYFLIVVIYLAYEYKTIKENKYETKRNYLVVKQ